MVRQVDERLHETIAHIVDRALYRHPSEMYPASDERTIRPFDYERVARILAAVEAARFFEEHFPLAHNAIGKEALLRYACSQAAGPGEVLEFGVMEGRTLRILCECFPDGPVHGFDSFEGLPEDWRHDKRRGAFSTNGLPPDNLPANAELHVGMFADTLPAYRQRREGPVRLLHIDSDIYSSARDVLFGLSDRLVAGSIIVFDEYLNYPGWRRHEHRAFTEFVTAFGVEFEYIAFASSYLSVAVRLSRGAAS